MPGDHWQKLANLRALLAYQFTRPGKKLLFMGTELAPPDEWNHDHSLDWHLLDDPSRARACATTWRGSAHVYRELPPLWQRDRDPRGFEWIDIARRRALGALVRAPRRTTRTSSWC